ncbi:MAG: type 4a pilus biogenesis protein PilO [Candidatus Omnitrophica bacterium]|nr:type 4a pilus biogenesis protein PilO [Candidatus Omnitrophota bacterium]
MRAWLLGGVFILLLITFFIRLLLVPAIGKIGSLNQEIKETKQKVRSTQQGLANMARMKAEIARLRQKAEVLEVRFPSEAELPNLLEHLSEVAEKSNVKIVEISPSKTVEVRSQIPQARYRELPIVILARSGYHELGTFINQLENSERLFSVKDISIKADPSNQRLHHVRLTLETFVREKESP